MEKDLGFAHRYVPGEGDDPNTLLLLHGTGGNEDDLVPLGRMLRPGAAILSPRGKVLEHGMPRFFRRLAEGVFDEEDLKERTHELAGFVERAIAEYGRDPSRVLAAGFSNGANIAASLLLLHPGLLARTPVYLAAGRTDPIIPPENTERLARLLQDAGADVTLDWQPGGHGIGREEVEAARRWMNETLAREG